MKVVLTFPQCHRRGGVERVMVECASFLAGRGHDVSVLAAEFDDGCLPAQVRPVAIRPAGAGRLLRLHRFAANGARVLGSRRFDAHGSFGVVCPPGGVLWVQSVHAAWLETSRRVRGPIGRLKQRLNLFHPYALHRERYYLGGRRYAKVVALTLAVKADVQRFYGVPDADIVVLPNGFNPAEFHTGRRNTERHRVRAELGYGDGDRVIVFVANELERKGFAPLLRALAASGDPSLRLLAVGRLNDRAYATEIQRLGWTGRTRFAGPSADVGRYYAAADLFALPTQYEAWGLVVVEAMASGLPVLTSRLAGAAVAVQEGVTGELLDDPQSVAEIQEKLSRLLGRAAPAPETVSASVQPYAWPSILTRYESVLLGSCPR